MTSTSVSPKWELYYWPILGRGIYPQVIFEDQHIDYKLISDPAVLRPYFFMGANKNSPVLAPPMVKNGDFQIAQTSAIIHHLGSEFNLMPSNAEDSARALQYILDIADFFSEAYAAIQTDEKKTEFCKEGGRYERFFNHFEKCLFQNNKGKEWIIGSSISYVDLALFANALIAKGYLSEKFESFSKKTPLLVDHYRRLSVREGLKAFLASDRLLKPRG